MGQSARFIYSRPYLACDTIFSDSSCSLLCSNLRIFFLAIFLSSIRSAPQNSFIRLIHFCCIHPFVGPTSWSAVLFIRFLRFIGHFRSTCSHSLNICTHSFDSIIRRFSTRLLFSFVYHTFIESMIFVLFCFVVRPIQFSDQFSVKLNTLFKERIRFFAIAAIVK